MKAIKLALVSLVLAAAVHAQSGQADQRAAPPVAGGAVLGVEVREIGMIAEGYRVSKLLKQTVYNEKNERVGKLEELIVRPDGTLSWAIVDVGGFLGIARHRVAIPISQFQSVRPKIVLPGATKDALKAMPEFKYADGV